jgi:hypothetical protein
MTLTTTESTRIAQVNFGRGGYNKDGDDEEDSFRCHGRGGYNGPSTLINCGRGGYNRKGDDDEEDGRGGYN